MLPELLGLENSQWIIGTKRMGGREIEDRIRLNIDKSRKHKRKISIHFPFIFSPNR